MDHTLMIHKSWWCDSLLVWFHVMHVPQIHNMIFFVKRKEENGAIYQDPSWSTIVNFECFSEKRKESTIPKIYHHPICIILSTILIHHQINNHPMVKKESTIPNISPWNHQNMRAEWVALLTWRRKPLMFFVFCRCSLKNEFKCKQIHRQNSCR